MEYDSALPEEWRARDVADFSRGKTLYDYQQKALKNAALALYLYYGGEKEWRGEESPEEAMRRKEAFLARYGAEFPAQKFAVRRQIGKKQNPIFPIYAQHIKPDGGEIRYAHFINRMSFWMATGAGKTLVLVKMIAHLERLKKARKIPPRDILVLAPTEHALSQIRRAVEDFNAVGGARLEMRHLRELGKDGGLPFADAVRVYYCRADHLSEERKEQMMDWRDYENGGKWFVFLDEAHKGARDDSKRKAYYALLARAGFLFNFSATFADDDDVYAAAVRYNLGDFVGDGRGKRIFRAASSFGFRGLGEERFRVFSEEHKMRIVLESLLALAAARECAEMLRGKTGRPDLYHMPLMLTLVNSVNTEDNDLLRFFSVLRRIAQGDLDQTMFDEVKRALLHDWKNGARLFPMTDDEPQTGHDGLKNMTVARLREIVFGGGGRGALEYAEDARKKQIAFKLKTAAAPFALIKIGDIKKFAKDSLRGMESVPVREGGGDWFAGLDKKSEFSILMGSRAFFESWDSTRPNVINFINIGTANSAKIFITQSVGRGVRIAPLPDKRRRMRQLLRSQFLPADDRDALRKIADDVAPLETLMLYATNQTAVDNVLAGMKDDEKSPPFAAMDKDLFRINPPPRIGGEEMTLLIPEYGAKKGGTPRPFCAAESAMRRLAEYAANVSDSFLLAAAGMSPAQIAEMRAVAGGAFAVAGNDYDITAMMDMFRARAGQSEQEARGMRKIEEQDIVHFRRIEAALPPDDIKKLVCKIAAVAKGGDRGAKTNELFNLLQDGKISREEFLRRQENLGAEREEYEKHGVILSIRRCARHYYAPLITADGRADFIRFVMQEKSETEFVEKLEKWLDGNTPDWKWMFCKINEHRDAVHIPYFRHNRAAKFFPDFVFWMRREDEYRIVFVDPKGMQYAAHQQKVDGYARLFEKDGAPRVFAKDGMRVTARLLLYNATGDAPPAEYRRFWTDSPAAIFAG